MTNLIPYIGIIIPFICGLISILIIFGKEETIRLLKPMRKPFFRPLSVAVLLSFTIKITLVSIIVMFRFSDISTVQNNGYIDGIATIGFAQKLILFITLLLSMIGEELILASIILPLYYFLKKNQYGWVISVLLSGIIFSLMHIETYNFNFWICITVGLSHLPMTHVWKSTESLRGGIYSHIIYNLFSILPVLVL